jgi:hypothetical protein
MGPSGRLSLAREQLGRAQVAGFEPVDWAELSIWAFYALENAVIAAADHSKLPWERTHTSKVNVARVLRADKGLPDASSLLVEPNELRKSEAYGEVRPSPPMDAEDVLAEVEQFIEAVAQLVEGERP